ncbi:MAG: S8 family peptidase [Bdellovibrionia bacterium]
MDVNRFLIAVACTLTLSACGNSKSVNSVFPENGNVDASVCKGQTIESRYIVQWESGEFTVESADNVESFKTNFIEPQLAAIRHVEYDRVFEIASSPSLQPQSLDDWNVERVNLQELWQQGYYGQGVIVGVVDSHVEVNHPQLVRQIAFNTNEIPNNGIDDDKNGVVDDYSGAIFLSGPPSTRPVSQHGTHVTGTIVADHDAGDVKGAAPRAKFVSAQFLTDDGGGYLGDAVLALQYAASRGARIINASWGGAPCVDSLRNAFVNLEQRGVLVVVAAGNEGKDIDYSPQYPASFNLPLQITVGASTELDIMAGWSNSGFSSVHLAAPGSNIFSTVPTGTAYFDGTSMAAPLVSGVAAALWSARPQATAYDIKRAILESVVVSPNREFKTITRGRLDASRALKRLTELLP